METEIVHYGGNLIFKIEVWNGQRIMEEERVKTIVEYQINYYNNNKKWNMFHWCFAGCLLNDTIYIVDGQHRKEAYDRLKESEKKLLPKIPILVQKVDNEDEIIDSFQTINKCKPQDLVDIKGIKIDKSFRTISMQGVNIYKANHLSIFTEKKAIKPKINATDLINSISFYHPTDEKQVNNILEQFSSYCFKNVDKKEIKESHLKLATTANCYIGLLTRSGTKGWDNLLKTFMYEFPKEVEIVVNEQSDVKIELKSNKRKKSKQSLRTIVWKHYFPEKKKGECFCCQIDIDRYHDKWHASHVHPVSKGGIDNIKNLVVCCQSCNLSIGSKHMKEWLEEQIEFGLEKYKKAYDEIDNIIN